MRKRNSGKNCIALLLVCALLLSGCAENTVRDKQQEIETWGLEPVFDYEVPVSVPTLRVDQAGYLPNASKMILAIGDLVPTAFEIVNASTGNIAYTGAFAMKGEDPKTGEKIFYGTFTELQTEGSYYAKADIIGCSDYFSIGENCYDTTILNLVQKLTDCEEPQADTLGDMTDFSGGWFTDEEGNKDVVTGCEAISYQLLGYEIYPEFYTEYDTIMECLHTEIEWLLKMQDKTNGGVFAGVRSTDTNSSVLRDVNFEATAAFAGTLAKYSFLYQEKDYAFANKCLQAAAKAWTYLEKNKKEEYLPTMFYGAAELYRASNSQIYNQFILDNGAICSGRDFSIYAFLGEVTYLQTRRNVNKDLCSVIITNLMKRSEHITSLSKENVYMIDMQGEGETEVDNILNNMVDMTVTDYVITNYEYSTMIENQVHYLMGRNETGSSIYFTDLADVSAMLLLLCGIISEKEMISS